jgi:hypothetical protein
MLIAIGNRPNVVPSGGVVGLVGLSGEGSVVRVEERGVGAVLEMIRPAAAAGGRGGGVWRFA